MRRLFCGVVTLCAVMPASATAQTFRTYRCSNSTVLRVIFDEERRSATIVPFGRPSIRLRLQEEAGAYFRYTRRDSYELRGTLQQVQWRSGRAQRTCRS